MSKKPSTAPDSSERGPKPLSDEEIKNSVMGESTEYYRRTQNGDPGSRKDRD